MEHIAAFLLIVGCTPDLADCREIPTPTAIYETVEDCQAERPRLAARHEDAAPRMFAQCFEVDPLLTESDAEIVWNVSPAGNLHAWVEPYAPEEVLVAMSRDGKGTETVAHR